MKVKAIKTRALLPPKDNLFEVIGGCLKKVTEKSILVVTSKVVAIHQGRCVSREKAEKDELIIRESERYIPRSENSTRMMLAMRNNLIIPAAGIDVSNGNGYFILWPEEPEKEALRLNLFIREKYGLKESGVIIVDSHTIPLRWGVIGISLAHHGFCPLNDYRQSLDIFGRKSLRLVLQNVTDSLAAAAVLVMGEGNERTPLALVTDIPFVKFGDCGKGIPGLKVDPNKDIYAPLIKNAKWKKGGADSQ